MLGDAFNVDTMEKMRRPPFEVEDFELGEKCQDASPSEARPISLNPSLTLTMSSTALRENCHPSYEWIPLILSCSSVETNIKRIHHTLSDTPARTAFIEMLSILLHPEQAFAKNPEACCNQHSTKAASQQSKPCP